MLSLGKGENNHQILLYSRFKKQDIQVSVPEDSNSSVFIFFQNSTYADGMGCPTDLNFMMVQKKKIKCLFIYFYCALFLC
ncbi:unnamed protein product [Phytomonas sp. EM1]|nr:unnamed protein product [Phytomonas sp. EM1]|eukprot:CCW59738.1 unnamed protein product [Phytomonas sp. isolate EM1]